MAEAAIDLWVKLLYAAALVLIAAVYWRAYGPSNYLWLSDIAFACIVLAVIFESPLLASMPAVGVLPLEILWAVDFMSGGRTIGIAGYMFDPKYTRFLRSLSLFHLALPPTMLWMLWRYGYDPRAMPLQLVVTWGAVGACYLFTEPEKNINWAFGPGEKPQTRISPRLYFALLLSVFSAVILAMHLLLKWLFPMPA